MELSNTNIGFAGLGAMGSSMVDRMLDQGLAVTVWNRSVARTSAAAGRGARVAATPGDLARDCDIVGLCLADSDAVEAVATGPGGILSVPPGRTRIVVDFSTIDPARSRALTEVARSLGIEWVDCPVSGGVPAARAGRLIGFAGATVELLAQARALTDSLFAKITPMGPPGTGQFAKLCNQWIVASNVLVIAEALAAARALGLDADRLPAALAGGFADSQPLQIFGPRMLAGTVEPRMGAIGLMRKDARLALAAGESTGATLPMLRHAVQVYDSVAGTPGLALDDDISMLIKLFEPT